MAPVEDDTTYADETVDDTYASTYNGNSTVTSGKKENPILKRLFATCEQDALGSVHRAWAVTVLFMVLFFIVAIIEANQIGDDYEVSNALCIASYWSAFLHLIFAILGTFVLKRFSTAFAVGCFLGCSVVISQQNLFMFLAFIKYQHGSVFGNVIFADLAFALCGLLTFFSLILGHFRHFIIVKQ
mmetsp:Transcript_11764/g.18052  ORF Transcript_11764/g.18052 Transcript_11764/m.18052 type:complete len:185 (-) Transcript_11764:423-977(-)|eukprot:CAMPEP_0201720974 /NCGR_PEP_ID=MMETSP0593-20130828/5790_1 /ASSEMBLY_ACC=CAM_ASM_000672 /TAXON_ID=267983 /ORGANISM="Skeletonema japonicum, Strain CCMP2506" /LENGTH=184 /DNA_ID=CAMNT_0048211711 /DNA_START=24 /DNA_END=578 /DNA_ORIENTATION=+